MKGKQQFIFVLIFLFVTACTTAVVDPPEEEPEATAPPNNAIIIDFATEAPTAVAKVTVTPDEPTLADEPIIIYGRSGGIAGRIEEWTIYPDGQIESRNGDTTQTDPEEVSAIVTTAVADGFNDLDDEYMPRNDCCDLITYTITIDGKTVTTMDGAIRPELLDDTITAVEDLIFDSFTK